MVRFKVKPKRGTCIPTSLKECFGQQGGPRNSRGLEWENRRSKIRRCTDDQKRSHPHVYPSSPPSSHVSQQQVICVRMRLVVMLLKHYILAWLEVKAMLRLVRVV
jgi:hypothetical protein